MYNRRRRKYDAPVPDVIEHKKKIRHRSVEPPEQAGRRSPLSRWRKSRKIIAVFFMEPAAGFVCKRGTQRVLSFLSHKQLPVKSLLSLPLCLKYKRTDESVYTSRTWWRGGPSSHDTEIDPLLQCQKVGPRDPVYFPPYSLVFLVLVSCQNMNITV